MPNRTNPGLFDRRTILKAAVSLPAAALWSPSAARNIAAAYGGGTDPLPVAAIVTEYRTNTHADVIVGKILEGFDQQGGPGPGLRLVSLFADQVPEADRSRGLAKKHGFRIARTIDDALTLGGDQLAVAGVLSIAEHGNYDATPDTQQVMYPRRRFFDEIVATFRRCGKVVPVFNDKHLSYNWADAKHMADTARELSIPFMAGSSVPVGWRQPSRSLPMGCEIEAALAVGYGGFEAYGFHALEMLQCQVERRQGGETGVTRVQAVQGDGIWQAERAGRWSRPLLEAALASIPNVKPGPLEQNLGQESAFYLLDYRDGLRATLAMANGLAGEFALAVKLKGQPEPIAIWFRLQEGPPFGHFGYLLRAIDHMFQTGKPAYPVERTLLTTGVLDAAMHSLAQQHAPLDTPELAIAYQPVDWPFASGAP